jgi:hypothetical protein
MGVILEIGQHNPITAKEKKAICDCWAPEGEVRPAKGFACKCKGCFLEWEERWRRMSTAEQKADHEKRSAYAKDVVKMVTGTLKTISKIRKPYFSCTWFPDECNAVGCDCGQGPCRDYQED